MKMAWKGEKIRHALARKGIKTSVGDKYSKATGDRYHTNKTDKEIKKILSEEREPPKKAGKKDPWEKVEEQFIRKRMKMDNKKITMKLNAKLWSGRTVKEVASKKASMKRKKKK